MTASPSHQYMTADDLLALPAKPGVSYELVRGELRLMSPSASLPGVVSLNLGAELRSHVRTYKLGVCGTADSGFRLASDPDTVRAPDAWFVRSENVPADGIPRTFWPGTPDLAIEVLSPSDRLMDVLEKAREYLDAGTLLVWVVDPIGRSAAIFRPGQPPQLIREDGVLDGGDVVSGFAIALRDVLP